LFAQVLERVFLIHSKNVSTKGVAFFYISKIKTGGFMAKIETKKSSYRKKKIKDARSKKSKNNFKQRKGVTK